MKIVLIIAAGLVSVFLTEIVAFLWMTYAPPSIDLVGSFFLAVVLPSVLLVVLIAALSLRRAFAANPLRNTSIYSAVFLVAQAVGLNQLGNPPINMLAYAAIVAGVCVAVFSLLTRYAWSDRQ